MTDRHMTDTTDTTEPTTAPETTVVADDEAFHLVGPIDQNISDAIAEHERKAEDLRAVADREAEATQFRRRGGPDHHTGFRLAQMESEVHRVKAAHIRATAAIEILHAEREQARTERDRTVEDARHRVATAEQELLRVASERVALDMEWQKKLDAAHEEIAELRHANKDLERQYADTDAILKRDRRVKQRVIQRDSDGNMRAVIEIEPDDRR